jgi:hypothetical protein
MTDEELNRAFSSWCESPGETVTSFTIFRAGYRLAEKEIKAADARIKLLERENAWLESDGTWKGAT